MASGNFKIHVGIAWCSHKMAQRVSCFFSKCCMVNKSTLVSELIDMCHIKTQSKYIISLRKQIGHNCGLRLFIFMCVLYVWQLFVFQSRTINCTQVYLYHIMNGCCLAHVYSRVSCNIRMGFGKFYLSTLISSFCD